MLVVGGHRIQAEGARFKFGGLPKQPGQLEEKVVTQHHKQIKAQRPNSRKSVSVPPAIKSNWIPVTPKVTHTHTQVLSCLLLMSLPSCPSCARICTLVCPLALGPPIRVVMFLDPPQSNFQMWVGKHCAFSPSLSTVHGALMVSRLQDLQP